MEARDFYLLMPQKIHQFKAKDSEIKKYPCFWEILQKTFLLTVWKILG